MRAKFINEEKNIGFERGIDPRKAMGIGRQALIERWLDEMGVGGWSLDADLRIIVDGDVNLSSMGLKLFPSFIQFKKVEGSFYLSDNGLTSLRGAPSYVGGDFTCSYNKLKTLIWAPSIVDGSFYCNYNNLTDLKGSPSIVKGRFSCGSNKLVSLEGITPEIGGFFVFVNNPLKISEEEVRKMSHIIGEVHF